MSGAELEQHPEARRGRAPGRRRSATRITADSTARAAGPRTRPAAARSRAGARACRRRAPTRSRMPTSPWPDRSATGAAAAAAVVAAPRPARRRAVARRGRRAELRRAGVPSGVGQGLLHDAVRGQVDRGRQRRAGRPRRRAATGRPAPRRRSTSAGKVGRARGRRAVADAASVAQDAEQPAHLVQRAAAGRARSSPARPRPARGRRPARAAPTPAWTTMTLSCARRRRAARGRSGAARRRPPAGPAPRGGAGCSLPPARRPRGRRRGWRGR